MLKLISLIIGLFLLPMSAYAGQNVNITIKSQTALFELEGIQFNMPLQDMTIIRFIDKSIGYVPKDVVRDGLPHFGSQRDDWLSKPRLHKGYDIYANHINVLAMAAGEVVAVRPGKRSGLYVKLKHEKEIYTLYVHLTGATVDEGDRVKQGQVIGRIDGAAGNAMGPQLHLEVKPENKSIDPLPLIESYYRNDAQITQKVQSWKQKLPILIQDREQRVREYLQKQQ